MTPGLQTTDLSAPVMLAGLAETRFRHVEVHHELVSTQARLASRPGRDGQVVIADYQSAGRGRAGRTWESPAGTALLMSVRLQGIEAPTVPLVGLAGAVAVSRALDECGLATSLKWPNDVLVDDRKICGLLGELVGGGDVVLGAGINVGQSAEQLPAEVQATSVALELGRAVGRGELAVRVLGHLHELLASGSWLAEYRQRCTTIGRRVRVLLADGQIEGTATEVRDDGALVVDGRGLLVGDVVHLREAS